MFQNRFVPLVVFLSCMLLTLDSIAEEFVFHHENVLGTSFELRVDAVGPQHAQRAEAIALQEIDRLDRVFSQYRNDSDLSRVLRLPVGATTKVSSELVYLLKRCDAWTSRSSGAFNPAVDSISKRWKKAASEGEVPSADELMLLANRVNQKHWQIDLSTCQVQRVSSESISLNAIAKGTIIDLVADKVLGDGDDIRAITVNIGGDLCVRGAANQIINIPYPKFDAIGARPAAQFVLEHGAVATSGVSERGFQVGNQSFSHIIDPRVGKPCSHVSSASVIAENAETADVLATVCSVLPISSSIALIDSIPGAACLLFDIQGTAFVSAHWPGADPLQTSQASQNNQPPSPHEFLVEFEIAKAADGGRYRRPYVAVWVEDKDGFPVKTLSLFLMTDNPGPRWHRDLRRWYSSDQVRLLVDETKLIGTVSKPTRNPGSYKVNWDGRDDHDKLLNPGIYTLYIEAAREHGTYQLIKHSFEIGGKEYEEKLKGNVEIKSASIQYKRKK